MSDVVITEFMDDASVRLLKDRFDTLYDPKLVDRPEDMAAAAKRARALIVRNRTQVRGALLEGAVRLECVGRLGVGLDNVDLDACGTRGIRVYPATGANDLSVAEYVITMALTLLRGAYDATAAVVAGQWPRQDLIGRELSGKVLGLVGYGAIARQVAARATALGMDVVANDPFLDAADPAWKRTRSVPLEMLLENADVVSLHVPLTPATRHLIDASAMRRMKSGAVLVNAARGGVVDEEALVAALKAGGLAGAALDVFETEPLTREAGRKFVGIDNLILTPHIAGVTRESNIRVSRMIAEKVIGHLEKE